MLREELQAGDDFLDDQKMKKYEGLMEKKWTSVVRLQKKVRALRAMPPMFFFSAAARTTRKTPPTNGRRSWN